MSSSGFNVIRRHSSDAASIRIKELTQELAKQRSDLAGSQLETDDVRSQGRMDHSTIKLNDESLKFVTTLSSIMGDFVYEFPTEPDLNFLKVWFMLDHLGARMRDISGFANHAFISGHPTLRRINLDIGFQQTATGGGISATPMMLFNSGTDVVSSTNGEYIWVPDNDSIQFIEFAAGFSIVFRFKCLDFNNHITEEFGTFVRRFAAKTDDALNGWNLVVTPTNAEGTQGAIEMNIVHNGTTYRRKRTGFNTTSFYQVVITYDPNLAADSRIKIYVAGVESSVAGTTTLSLPTHPNLRIGARDPETGFFYGYLHDFRLYMGKILTQTEVTNINNNELTIDNIAKGHGFIIQYAMVSILARSKIHRYSINGRVRRDRIHKFNVINKLIKTRTHKYNMVKGVSRTRTHKFTMVGLAKRLRTHKFSLGGKVIVTKTHKFNLTGNAVLTQVVRFQKNTSGSAGATQDIPLNFTPIAIQVISIGTTADNSVVAHYQYSHGFSDGTNHACVVSASRDAVGNSDTSRTHRTDCVFARLDDLSNNTITCRASVSFSTNNVRFTWDVNDTNALYITVLAVGGVGITNAKVNTVAVGRSTTGVQNYTGLGFDPVANESVIFTLGSHSDSIGSNINNIVDYTGFNFGCAVSTTKRWSVANCAPSTLATSDTYRRYSNALVIAELNQGTGTDLHSADFNGWITDGFALNWTTAPLTANYAFSYLVIKGGQWDAGNLTAPTAITANVDYAVSVSSKVPKMLLISSSAQITSGITTNALFSTGVTDGTTQIVHSEIDEDAQATMDNYKIQNTGNVVKLLTLNGVVTDIGTFDSFSANNFRIDWTTKSVNAQLVGWVVVADK